MAFFNTWRIGYFLYDDKEKSMTADDKGLQTIDNKELEKLFEFHRMMMNSTRIFMADFNKRYPNGVMVRPAPPEVK